MKVIVFVAAWWGHRFIDDGVRTPLQCKIGFLLQSGVDHALGGIRRGQLQRCQNRLVIGFERCRVELRRQRPAIQRIDQADDRLGPGHAALHGDLVRGGF